MEKMKKKFKIKFRKKEFFSIKLQRIALLNMHIIF